MPNVHATAWTWGFPDALLGPMRTPKAAASTNSRTQWRHPRCNRPTKQLIQNDTCSWSREMPSMPLASIWTGRVETQWRRPNLVPILEWYCVQHGPQHGMQFSLWNVQQLLLSYCWEQNWQSIHLVCTHQVYINFPSQCRANVMVGLKDSRTIHNLKYCENCCIAEVYGKLWGCWATSEY